MSSIMQDENTMVSKNTYYDESIPKGMSANITSVEDDTWK